jgi:hypothetical protein
MSTALSPYRETLGLSPLQSKAERGYFMSKRMLHVPQHVIDENLASVMSDSAEGFSEQALFARQAFCDVFRTMTQPFDLSGLQDKERLELELKHDILFEDVKQYLIGTAATSQTLFSTHPLCIPWNKGTRSACKILWDRFECDNTFIDKMNIHVFLRHEIRCVTNGLRRLEALFPAQPLELSVRKGYRSCLEVIFYLVNYVRDANNDPVGYTVERGLHEAGLSIEEIEQALDLVQQQLDCDEDFLRGWNHAITALRLCLGVDHPTTQTIELITMQTLSFHT